MIEPLTDAELAIGASESPQALEQLKLSYRALRAEINRLTFALHCRRAHPDFEYTTTQTARKSEDDPRVGLDGKGWERNDIVENHAYKEGVVVKEHWRNWERFQFHEDNYWRRRKRSE